LLKISNASSLDETTIIVDMILHLSLYYFVKDLVHLSNLTIKFYLLNLCMDIKLVYGET